MSNDAHAGERRTFPGRMQRLWTGLYSDRTDMKPVFLTVFAQEHTLTVLYLSYPVSWFVTFAIHFLCYWFIARKRLGKGTAAPVPE